MTSCTTALNSGLYLKCWYGATVSHYFEDQVQFLAGLPRSRHGGPTADEPRDFCSDPVSGLKRTLCIQLACDLQFSMAQHTELIEGTLGHMGMLIMKLKPTSDCLHSKTYM